MRHVFKYGLAIMIYLVILVVLDYIMGIGIKDQWDSVLAKNFCP